MELSIEALQDWLLKQKAIRHEELKLRLQELKNKKNYANILNKPIQVKKYDRQIRRLEKKLQCHININS